MRKQPQSLNLPDSRAAEMRRRILAMEALEGTAMHPPSSPESLALNLQRTSPYVEILQLQNPKLPVLVKTQRRSPLLNNTPIGPFIPLANFQHHSQSSSLDLHSRLPSRIAPLACLKNESSGPNSFPFVSYDNRNGAIGYALIQKHETNNFVGSIILLLFFYSRSVGISFTREGLPTCSRASFLSTDMFRVQSLIDARFLFEAPVKRFPFVVHGSNHLMRYYI